MDLKSKQMKIPFSSELTENVLRLDDVQADEGVVAVQSSQQQVHPLQDGSHAERPRQLPESGLGEETPTFKLPDQELLATVLQ